MFLFCTFWTLLEVKRNKLTIFCTFFLLQPHDPRNAFNGIPCSVINTNNSNYRSCRTRIGNGNYCNKNHPSLDYGYKLLRTNLQLALTLVRINQWLLLNRDKKCDSLDTNLDKTQAFDLGWKIKFVNYSTRRTKLRVLSCTIYLYYAHNRT